MKNILYLSLLIAAISCTNTKVGNTDKAEQEYVMIDVRVRQYHKDGTRTYKDYQSFKTRTVENLAGFTPSKRSVKLSKYGDYFIVKGFIY